MPVRTLIELLHIAAGLMATALITAVGAWAYPLGGDTIRLVGWCAGAAVVLMGIGPLRRAWTIDRGGRDDDRK